MKLEKGQRWLSKEDDYYKQMLVEILNIDEDGAGANCITLQSEEPTTKVGSIEYWSAFPDKNKCENEYWKYLKGQDAP